MGCCNSAVNSQNKLQSEGNEMLCTEEDNYASQSKQIQEEAPGIDAQDITENLVLEIESFEKAILSNKLEEFLFRKLSQRMISKSKDLICNDQALQTKLLDIIYNSRYLATKDKTRIQIASNAITLLNAAGVSFSGLDFRKIKINGADLSNAILHKTNFEAADLKEVNFSRAYLVEANFKNANLYMAKFDRLLSIKLDISPCCMIWSPNSKYVVTGLQNGKIKVWDSKDGSLYREFNGHSTAVKALDIAVDGSLMISGGNDQNIKVWKIKEEEYKKNFRQFYGHKSAVEVIKITKDHKFAISGGRDDFLILWNMKFLKKSRIIKSHHQGWVYDLTVSDDSKTFYTASADHNIHVFNLYKGSLIKKFEQHRNSINSICYQPKSAAGYPSSNLYKLVSASADNSIRLWNVESQNQSILLRGHHSAVNCIDYSPDGRYIISGGRDKTLRFWQSTGPSRRHDSNSLDVIYGHDEPITQVKYQPKGKKIASISEGNELMIWDVDLIKSSFSNNLSETVLTPGHADSIKAIKVSPDGKYIVSGGADRIICVWDTYTGQLVQELTHHETDILSLDIAPQSDLLISGDKNNSIFVVSLKNEVANRFQVVKELQDHADSIYSLKFNSSGQKFCSTSHDRTIKVWDAQKLTCMKTLSGHKSAVNYADFSHNGKFIASGSSDLTIRIWKGWRVVLKGDFGQKIRKNKYIRLLLESIWKFQKMLKFVY